MGYNYKASISKEEKTKTVVPFSFELVMLCPFKKVRAMSSQM